MHKLTTVVQLAHPRISEISVICFGYKFLFLQLWNILRGCSQSRCVLNHSVASMRHMHQLPIRILYVLSATSSSSHSIINQTALVLLQAPCQSNQLAAASSTAFDLVMHNLGCNWFGLNWLNNRFRVILVSCSYSSGFSASIIDTLGTGHRLTSVQPLLVMAAYKSRPHELITLFMLQEEATPVRSLFVLLKCPSWRLKFWYLLLGLRCNLIVIVLI